MVAGCATSPTFTDPVASFFAVPRIPSAGRLFIASIVLFIKDCEARLDCSFNELLVVINPDDDILVEVLIAPLVDALVDADVEALVDADVDVLKVKFRLTWALDLSAEQPCKRYC